MPTNALTMPDIKDAFFLIPHIILTVWGLLVLLVDVSLFRRKDPIARRNLGGWLSMVGAGLALAAAVFVCLVVPFRDRFEWLFSTAALDAFADQDRPLFFGTLSGDTQVAYFNVLYTGLLLMVLWLSTAWSFTEEWGEYFALMFWATVGMMLLTASEELVTLFITLETMTICLYLSTAMEKSRRRSAEGGLKYFVYGSVSSALFLFGLSLLYGLTGTTYFDGIRQVLGGTPTRAATGQFEFAEQGLADNVAGAAAVLLMLVGFGFKVAAVPFHQWAPDAYEGAPAPVTAWIATGSKLASFVALMKVFLHALLPWSNPSNRVLGPGWLGIVVFVAAVTMTYGNFAALAQRNLKRMLAYSSIAHAGYILVGVAAASVAVDNSKAAGAVLYYLVVYAFANVGAFAVAAWLVRDKSTDDIDDLNGLGFQEPLLAGSILVLMLSLIGIPPLAGFFGKLYVFMEALDQRSSDHAIPLIWLVALGLFNSVISAFYYVRVLKAMYLREPGERRLAPPSRSIAVPILLGAGLMIVCGIMPDMLLGNMQAAAFPMLTSSAPSTSFVSRPVLDEMGNIKRPVSPVARYTPEQLKQMEMGTRRGAASGPPPATKKAGGPGTPKKAGRPAGPAATKAPGGPAPAAATPGKAAAPPAEKKATGQP